MQKRVKPGLFSKVILPVVLIEILVILVSLFSAFYLINQEWVALVVILVSLILFFVAYCLLVLVYLIKYFSYESFIKPKARLNVLSLVGFVMVAVSYLAGTLLGAIPLLGVVFGFVFMLILLAGTVVSIVALVGFKSEEKGRGFANVGVFMGVYYLVHLVISIIAVVVMWVIVASFLTNVPG